MKKLLFGLTLGFLLSLNGFVFGQQQPPAPQLLSVYPAGGKVGTTTLVRIVEQSELEFADNLVFSHSGITSRPKHREKSRFFSNPTPVRNEFEVTIADNVPEGIYEVRAQCVYGFSNPRRFVVSKKDEVLEVEPNDDFEKANQMKVGSTANGLFEAGYDFFKVGVQPGQSLVFRCIAEQIDSRGDPVISIFDSNHRMIARNHDTRGKDALVSYQADKSEEIFVRVNDLTFVSQGGAGTTAYRLIVSEGPWIDFADPPVISKTQPTKIRLFGRNLGGGQSGIQKNGTELESLEVSVDPNALRSDTGRFSETCLAPGTFSQNRVIYQYETAHGKSNPVVLELCESSPIEEQKSGYLLKPDSEVLGSFSKPGEIDRYRFNAKKGDRFWIEVVSQRLGIAADPMLTIESIQKNKEGEESFRTLGTFDDLKPLATPFRIRLESEDPSTLFVAPSDGEFRLSINDQFNLPPNLNGPNYYKLILKRPTASIDLVAIAGLERGPNDNNSRPLKMLPCIVRPYGGAEIQVFAYRAPGFEVPVELNVTGVPAGVTAHPCVIHNQSNHGTIVLTGNTGLKSGFSKIKIQASFMHEGKKIQVPVAAAEITTNSVGNEPSESRLSNELLVITDQTISYPGTIELDQTSFETAIGGVIQPKAKLIKHPKHTGAVLQGFVYGFPRTVTKNTNTIPDNGTTVDYRIEFRQGSGAGEYSAFIRGYFEKNTKRFEKKFEVVTKEQERISAEVQKVETEYRNLTREKQSLTTRVSQQKQKLSQLASATRSAKVQLDAAKREVATAEMNRKNLQQENVSLTSSVKSLEQMMGLEKDAVKKQKLASEVAAKKQEGTTVTGKLNAAQTVLNSAKTKLDNLQKTYDKVVSDEKSGQQMLATLEKQLAEKTETEKRLLKERTLGQSIKREVDQELNLARQAARDSRCRYHIYSKPMRIKVADYPIELSVSKNNFSLEQGKTEKIQVNLKRLFGYKGQVTVQLRNGPGANGWSLKNDLRLSDGTSQAEAEIVVQKTAKVGKFTGEFRATMRNGNANLTKTIPITFEVKSAPKK